MNGKIKNLTSLLLVLIMLMSTSATASAETSFSFRFDDKHKRLLSDYPDYAAIVDENLSSTPMPGVENTKMGANEYCSNMVPQGFCFAGDYMLITAYDYKKEFNSVIYVISNTDINNRELLSVLVLDDKNHVGGIASDGEYVFIARSSKEEIGLIKLSDIENASKNEVAEINYYDKLPCDCTASNVSYYDGKIWVGVFTKFFHSQLYGFELITDSGKLSLKKTDKLYLPAKTQGIAFFEANSATYLAVSSSYGRKNTSKLRIFDVEKKDNTLSKSFITQFTMPPLTQETDVFNGYLYLSSEGAATEYTSTDCRNNDAPLDRIAAISIENLISEEYESGFFVSLFNHISTFCSEAAILIENIF